MGFPQMEEEAITLREIREIIEEYEEDFEYLCDSGTEFEGIKIWGSPWSPIFEGVNSKCKAFMARDAKLKRKFEKIPADTEILITHSPPCMILDHNIDGNPCGSFILLDQLEDRVHPKYHFFGHIHEQHGKHTVFKNGPYDTVCANVSYVDERYKPKDFITRVEITSKRNPRDELSRKLPSLFMCSRTDLDTRGTNK
jgi:hypothetical protein